MKSERLTVPQQILMEPNSVYEMKVDFVAFSLFEYSVAGIKSK